VHRPTSTRWGESHLRIFIRLKALTYISPSGQTDGVMAQESLSAGESHAPKFGVVMSRPAIGRFLCTLDHGEMISSMELAAFFTSETMARA